MSGQSYDFGASDSAAPNPIHGDSSTTTDGASASPPAEPPLGSPWEDLRAYIAAPRLGGLTLSADGQTLLVGVSSLDAKKTAYQTALWRIDPTGQRAARRHTRSVEGEAAAAFLGDGSLLFTSRRPVPPSDQEESEDAGVIWCLPADGGEAYVLARRDGGWGGITTAREGNTALFSVAVHGGAANEEADAKKRALRKKKKVSAILHEGYPVRFWDHDLGLESTRLYAAELEAAADLDHSLDSAAFRDLTGDVGRAIGQVVRLSADGRVAVTDWAVAQPHGVQTPSVVEIDTATGERKSLASDPLIEFGAPVISADGSLVLCLRDTPATPERAPEVNLWLIDRATGEGRFLAEDWDLWASPVAIAPDNATAYVVCDENGHGPIYAIDMATGARRRLTDQGTHGSVLLSPDGATLYAVRTSYVDPGTIVAVSTADGTTTELKAPTDYPELPGQLSDVETTAADGTRVRGYLLLPDGASAEQPAPLALWIHGGPLGSWNAWSWRWCPWLMVSRGYAVLLPDPALSTGYGWDFIQRGWGQWGGAPYTDLMSITDAVEQRPDIDETKSVAMGGSFGGYMANWVAGHTDRFKAIVTHASLWNLESFGPTTDASWYWARELSPQMQIDNSPHRFADQIKTPMLVIHGDKDYRVPISEGLALWWALVSGFDGAPEDLPHKFLYYPDENHWILTPQHAIVWYETVLAFLESHVGNGNFVRPEAL